MTDSTLESLDDLSDQVSEEWEKTEGEEGERGGGEGGRERKRVSERARKKAGVGRMKAKAAQLAFIWNVDLSAVWGKSRRFQRGAFFNLNCLHLFFF